jgi:transcriptional regulator with XRE-family HTH domain
MGRRRVRLGGKRAADQMSRMASELRLARATLALSRAETARRAAVARSSVERVEAGAPDVEVATLVAVMAAVGLDLVLHAYEGSSLRLRDTGQMLLVNHLRRLGAPYWRSQIEVAAGEFGRSADLVFYGADGIIHVEVERRATDFQAQLRSAKRKREVLASRGDRPVRLVLAVEDTRRNREALSLHAELIGSQLPAAPREVLRCLRLGQPLARDGLLWIRRRSEPHPSSRNSAGSPGSDSR